MSAGVYEIVCLGNSRKYIGSSVNVDRRLAEHKRKLIKGQHSISKLQADFNRFGAKAFKFQALQFCNSDVVVQLEQKYIDRYKTARELLYNLNLKATTPRETTMNVLNKFKKSRGGGIGSDHAKLIAELQRVQRKNGSFDPEVHADLEKIASQYYKLKKLSFTSLMLSIMLYLGVTGIEIAFGLNSMTLKIVSLVIVAGHAAFFYGYVLRKLRGLKEKIALEKK